MIQSTYKMDLQLFNDEAEKTEDNEKQTEEQPKTYTADELQAEADRRVTKALETSKQKWEKEYQQKIEQEKELAKLSEEEKAKKKLELEKEEFEKERLEFQRTKLELETTKILDERKLPTKFARYLIAEDAEKTFANIDEFGKVWQESIQAEIDARLKGKTPVTGTKTDKAVDPFIAGFKQAY